MLMYTRNGLLCVENHENMQCLMVFMAVAVRAELNNSAYMVRIN